MPKKPKTFVKTLLIIISKKQKQIIDMIVCDYALSRELALRSFINHIERTADVDHQSAMEIFKSNKRAAYLDGWVEEMRSTMESHGLVNDNQTQSMDVTSKSKAYTKKQAKAELRYKGDLSESPLLASLLAEEQTTTKLDNIKTKKTIKSEPDPEKTKNPKIEISTKIKEKNKKIWTVFVDGSVRIESEICTIAGVLRSPAKGRAAIKFKKQVNFQTVDMTEFQALYEALKIAKRYKVSMLRLYGDSKIALEYMVKIYRNIQVEHIKNSAQIKKLMNEFEYLDFIRCQRNMVQEAHNLCYELGEKLVLKQALKEVYCSLDKTK